MIELCEELVDRSGLGDEPELSPCGHEKADHWNIDGAGWYCRACYHERVIPIGSVEHAYAYDMCKACGEYRSQVRPGQCWKCSPDGRDDDD